MVVFATRHSWDSALTWTPKTYDARHEPRAGAVEIGDATLRTRKRPQTPDVHSVSDNEK